MCVVIVWFEERLEIYSNTTKKRKKNEWTNEKEEGAIRNKERVDLRPQSKESLKPFEPTASNDL